MKNEKKFLMLLSLCLILFLTGCSSQTESTITHETKISELSGQTIGVQTGTLSELALLARVPDVKLEYYQEITDEQTALKNGRIVGYIDESCAFGVEVCHQPWLDRIDEPIDDESIVIALGNNDRARQLQQQLNVFIADSKADGTLAELESNWVTNYTIDGCVVDKSGITGENGVVTVAVEDGYEPFSYLGADGTMQGFDIDFIYRFCRAYGYEPEIIPISFDAICPGIESGKYDMGTAIVYSDERSEDTIISDPYLTYHLIITIKGSDPDSTGFIEKIENSFYKTFIKDDRWQLFAEGALRTLLITIVSIIVGTLIGFAGFMLCKNGNVIANKIAGFLTWLIDGTPTVLLLLILYHLVFNDSAINGSIVCMIGFSLIFGSAVFAMLTTGYAAIPFEQTEVARALGYSDIQTLFTIILPQIIRLMLPSYKGAIVSLIKETSIVGYIAVQDLTKMSDIIRSKTFEPFFPLIATAVIYFLLSWLLTLLLRRIEFRVKPKRRSRKLKGVEMK